jgi:hypothetical protein
LAEREAAKRAPAAEAARANRGAAGAAAALANLHVNPPPLGDWTTQAVGLDVQVRTRFTPSMGLCKLSSVDPWLERRPVSTVEPSMVSKFVFKHTYKAEDANTLFLALGPHMAGLYKLNSVDPWLESNNPVCEPMK